MSALFFFVFSAIVVSWIAYSQFVIIPRAKRVVLRDLADARQSGMVWVSASKLRERAGVATSVALVELHRDRRIERRVSDGWFAEGEREHAFNIWYRFAA